jgi:hypothetical protein
MKVRITHRELGEVLYRIKRGLAGYVSYLAACDMNDAFSEYVLYEPILRILVAQGFTAHFEVDCQGIQQPAIGDRRRLDFEAIKGDLRFALEVKWARKVMVNVKPDLEKLTAYRRWYPSSKGFLCVFGRKTHLNKMQLGRPLFSERGKAVYADMRRTKFGWSIYESLV